MFVLLLLITSVSAECWTDDEYIDKDPTYTYLSSLELKGEGSYTFYPEEYDRFAIGSGINLEPDRAIQIYEFEKEGLHADFTTHDISSDPRIVSKLDLTKPFMIHITESNAELTQEDTLIVEFVLYLRMPFHIGWRRGILCFDVEGMEEVEEVEEVETPLTNFIMPWLKF